MDDRISDLARARRPRDGHRVGRARLTADVIRFIRAPRAAAGRRIFRPSHFVARPGADESADTAPCEYVRPDDDGRT
jgi:hypothetical protein